MKKSFLEYTGKGRIIIDVHKETDKDGFRKRVPISLRSMTKRFFRNDEVLDEQAIAYYNELKSLRIDFCLSPEDCDACDTTENLKNVDQENIDEVQTSDSFEKEESPEVESISESVSSEEVSELNNSTNITETEVDPVEEISENVENVEDTKNVEDVKDVEEISESDRAEMIAFLDSTYDRDGLKNLAKELEVEFKSNISSSRLIEKLIDERTHEIIEMIK